MAWTIISICAPSCVVNSPHNSIFRISDDLEYKDDIYAAKSPYEQSDNGTPAPTTLPPDVTLALTTEHFPKDPSVGFVFGTDRAKCDILLPSLSELSVSKRQFAITFRTTTGAVLLRNLSKQSTRIIMRHNLERVVLQSQRAFPKEGITVRFRGLAIDLNRPWGDNDVSDLYIAFLNRLAKTNPNFGALRLLSATESSARSSISQERSAYGSEIVVGSGASAVVYRATHRQTGDFVAIKRYKDKSSALSWKEARIFCTLNHRHIVTFHQFNVNNGGAELIMEYAVLGSLVDQIKANRLTVREACTTIKHTLLALQYLHGRGITHRDIKPGNILIMTRNPIHAKVADFGLSSKADHLNTFCGTKRYLAPEIHRPPYTAKVDIWSVGVMVMELWGVLPTQSDRSWAEKIVAHARQASNITTELLDACLQLDPNNRATAEQCLQIPFFYTGNDGKEEGAPFVNHLDDDGCATVVRREPLRLPDQQRQEPLAVSDSAWKGEGCVPAVRLHSSIPDTAACNMQESEPLDLPAQREEHLPAASKLVWNGEALEPFLPHGEGWQLESNLQLEDWRGENFGRLFPQGETQTNMFTHVPIEDIPTWNPVNVEEWVPGGANNYQSNAEAIGPGATLDNERLDVRGITYHFFDWRETKVAHIPDQAMVNVTHMVATAGLRFGQLRSAEFLEMTKDKKHVVQGQPHRIRGTYMLYSNAIDVCVRLKIDRSGLPSFLLLST